MQAYAKCAMVAAVLSVAACGGGGGGKENPPGETPVVTTLAPGQGITIQQVDFDFPGGAQPNSTWGRMVIDPVALGRTGDLKDGYISLVTEQGWAVVNVPVPPAGQPAHSIFFNLGLPSNMPIGDTQVDVKHSNLALQDVTPFLAQRVSWAVDPWVWQAQGVGPVVDTKLLPPDTPPSVIVLEDLPFFEFLTFAHYQAITNIQCAWNQCYPMATANGLQFLEDEGHITLTHNHSQGIGVTGQGENTLVGQLDLFANRSVTSRLGGSGVWFDPMIKGTFEYLEEYGLDGILTFRHQDDGYPGGEIGNVNFGPFFGATSVQDATTADWNWIDARIQDGCAVTMVFIAHAVRITGSGKTLGRRWIRYSHDASQSDDFVGLENVVTFLSDSDSNGLLNMGGSSNELRFVQAACP